MLDKRTRKKIEWHFYNCKADMKLYQERRQDIIESGLSAKLNNIGAGCGVGNPTQSKVEKLEELDAAFGNKRDWFAVIRNTFNAFRFLPEYDIMVALYIDGKSKSEALEEYFRDGRWQTTFWRWRDRWLECAYSWAVEFGLLPKGGMYV